MLSLRWCTAQAALRDYYNADGKDLNDLINNAKNLPPEANVAALHSIRRLSGSYSNRLQPCIWLKIGSELPANLGLSTIGFKPVISDAVIMARDGQT